MSLPDYFQRFNPELLSLIPPDAKIVLEVGCGAGKLAEAYRRINPSVEWYGIEANEEAWSVAHTRMKDCLLRDVEDPLIPIGMFFGGKPSVDCLIFGDVLEHLRDPWETLQTMALWLKPGGLVLASIPNVGHWSVILGLLKGEWEYTDEGLLDRTHLRFFTLKSIKTLFKGAGLEPFEIRGRKLCNEGFKEFCDVWFEKPNCSGPTWNQMQTYQYIVRALKPPADKPKALHIHAVTAEGCCARVRIEEPLKMLATIPGVRTSIYSPQREERALNPVPDIYIQQRWRTVGNLSMQRALLDAGCLIIAEWDDDPRNPYFGDLAANDYFPLRTCHAVMVSTEALAEVVREWNPEVAVFANQIAELPPPREYTKGGVRIFFGAQNREADWAPIMPALNRVIREFESRDLGFYVLQDRAFYDALATTRKIFESFVPYDRYRFAIRDCDIALLPLEDTEFNRCKSDLKLLECAAEGVAVLASEVVYLPTIQAIRDGHWFTRPDEFEANLRFLIRSTEHRRETAQAAYAYVRDHRLLSQHFRKRYEWFLELRRQKTRLDRSLAERVPELSQLAPQASRA